MFCWNCKARPFFSFAVALFNPVANSSSASANVTVYAGCIAIVLRHKTNGSVGISVVFILVVERFSVLFFFCWLLGFRVSTHLMQEETLHACFVCGLHITTFGGSFKLLPFTNTLGLSCPFQCTLWLWLLSFWRICCDMFWQSDGQNGLRLRSVCAASRSLGLRCL